MKSGRAALLIFLAIAVMVAPLTAEAQQAGKVYRIGLFATPELPAEKQTWDAFRQRLRELGYVEGQNLAIEWRSSEGKPERVPDVAAELVRLKVDVIVSGNSRAAIAAKRLTDKIPIVVASGDPVDVGLVSSLARPGGNVTGVSLLLGDIAGKQLELLKEVVPNGSKVAILWNRSNAFHARNLREAEAAAHKLGLQPQSVEGKAPEDLDRVFLAMDQARANSLLVLADPYVLEHRAIIADLAARRRLPAMYSRREHIEAGGLIAYGADRRELYRSLAVYVGKILNGAKPADLPVEQPTKFELVINLKTAKALGLTIPKSLLLRADEVIQ